MNLKLLWGGVVLAISVLALSIYGLVISSNDTKDQPENSQNPLVSSAEDALPALKIMQKNADIALPFCENKNCIDIEIQTIDTQDTLFNTWVNKSQAKVIQSQIGLNQDMNLQKAIDAYVRKSDLWQTQQKGNKPYVLAMYTRIAAQRNQYLLLQVGVDTDQENISIKERYYFFVLDRRDNKTLKILDVIDPKQQVQMNEFVQKAYQNWLKNQAKDVQKSAPQKLLWGQADWFFDHEGIGLHFRTNEIVKDAQQLDIYLTKAQTQQVVKPVIYKNMF